MRYLIRSGVKGQKWGHRYHQSYETKPTRSGMIGEEHGDAAKEPKLKDKPGSIEDLKKYTNNSGKIFDKKTINKINKDSQKNAADFSRREAGLMDKRVIPAGTKVYRTTIDKNEGVDGPKYISYMDVDRNLYKGGWVRQTGKSKASYENTYELKEDLRIPSNETVNKVIKDTILKDKTLTKEALESFDEMINGRNGGMTEKKDFERYNKAKNMTIEKARDIIYGSVVITEGDKNNLKSLEEDLSKKYLNDAKTWLKNNEESFKKYYGTTDYNKYMNKKIKEMRDMPIEEATFKVAQTYGKNTKAKDKVIAELKKQGYNAMPDYASIGGVGKFKKEGIDPLILFDGSESLNKKKVSGIKGTVGSDLKDASGKAAFYAMLGSGIAAPVAFAILFTKPEIAVGKEQGSLAKYDTWNNKANKKETVWRGSFIELNDLLRVSMRQVDISVEDLLRSGII